MQRAELILSDEEIIDQVEQSWNLKITAINYINTGSAFAFVLSKENGKKVFLKIIQKDNDDFSQFQFCIDSYQRLTEAFTKLKENHDIPHIPKIISTKELAYFYQVKDYIFVLYKFVEGNHPVDEKDINTKKLAAVFSGLHHLPIEQFSFLPKEDFDIEYALGVEKLLISLDNTIDAAEPMQQKLISYRQKLQRALHIMIMLKKKFEAIEFKYVLTHGDGHHYNILQTTSDLSLIDWQNPKLAPVERDLWHHANLLSLINEYHKLNPTFVFNQELCLFYKIQRFLEDIRFYSEQATISKEQKTEDTKDFLNHWGWYFISVIV